VSTTAARAAERTPPPKHILVNGKRIRLRLVQQVAWSFAAANAGALIISALYYLFTQLHWHVGGYQIMYLKPDWDHLFSYAGWPADRHDIRNLYETILATLFVKSLVVRWQKYYGKPVATWRIATAFPMIITVAAPFVVAGVYVTNHGGPQLWHWWFHRHQIGVPFHWPHSLAWVSNYLSDWKWQTLVIGIAAGQVIHRVYAPIGATVQGHFVDRQVDKTREAQQRGDWKGAGRHRPRFPLPPVVRERYAWTVGSDDPVPPRGKWAPRVIPFVAFVGLVLLGYGAYVRYGIA
jgi:hypothetical protein